MASLDFSGVLMLGRMVVASPDCVRDLAVESSLEGECSDLPCGHPYEALHKVLPTFLHHKAKDMLPLPEGVPSASARQALF